MVNSEMRGGYSITDQRGGCGDFVVKCVTGGLLGLKYTAQSHEPGSPQIDPEAESALANNLVLDILGFQLYPHFWGLASRQPKTTNIEPPNRTDRWEM